MFTERGRVDRQWFRAITFVLVILASPGGIASARTDWQQGKVVNVEIAAETTTPRGKATRDKVYNCIIDGGDRTYEGQESAKHAPRLEVNGTVEFSVSKDHLLIRDTGGKVIKLDLVKTTRKE